MYADGDAWVALYAIDLLGMALVRGRGREGEGSSREGSRLGTGTGMPLGHGGEAARCVLRSGVTDRNG